MGSANQKERTSFEASHASHSFVFDFDSRRKPTTPDFGVWVEDPKEGTFLVHGSESIMREIFGNIIEKMPYLSNAKSSKSS
jgi:hypothetical protein